MSPKKQRRTPSADDVRLSVTVAEDVYARLADHARERRVSMNLLLNEWIAEKLPRGEDGLAERQGAAPET